MKHIVASGEMRLAEAEYIKNTGVSALELMERAAEKLCAFILSHLSGEGRTCVFACGSGGNGGDGYACARIFSRYGGRAILLPVSAAKTIEAVINRDLALSEAFAFANVADIDDLPRPDMWVDCMLGTGAKRELTGDYARVVERINFDKSLGSKVVSCDLPTGLDCDSGEIANLCVNADATLCMQALKLGALIGRGMDVCGETEACDIGIPDAYFNSCTIKLIESGDAAEALPRFSRTADKRRFGHLLILAGSVGMAGAAAIAAKAALMSGAGLVTVACPESITPILQTLAPCAMCVPLPEENGAAGVAARDALLRALAGKTAIAAGPGLSTRADAGIIECVLNAGLPTVLDADALNIISKNDHLKSMLCKYHIITPHAGEAARLLGEEIKNPVECAKKLRSLGCRALLKGAASVICSDGIYVSATGCVGMAKGGSGDALTGIMGALLAQGVSVDAAAWLASDIHGRAGEKAKETISEYCMSPLDLIDSLKYVFPHDRA